MIDVKLLRENPEIVKKISEQRKIKIDINEVFSLDKKWRELKSQNDSLRAERNSISKQINESKKTKKPVGDLIKKAKEIPEKLSENETQVNTIKEKLDELLLHIPNIPAKDVPVGGEAANKEIHKKGVLPKFSFPVKAHWEIGESLEIIDLERATKLSGSGFYVLKGAGAQLQRALVQFMLDFHIKNGFTEINGPQIVLPEILQGTSQLPKFAEDLYKTNEGLYLIPTAEVSVTNLHRNETLREKDLPKKYCSFTQCYRTEAGRHGAESRGIFRLHEFEKVEMVCISKEEDSWKILEEITSYAEKLLEKLKLPYRKIVLSTEDMAFPSAKTYDLEVYSPHLKKYLEVSSCSNCTDFQARRMNTRYQTSNGELKFVHTLNGSGLALPRLMIALIENYQQKDGSIKIPTVLQPYMNGMKKISK